MEHTVAELLLRFSYPAILLLLAAAGLGVPISEDLVLLIGGALASQGVTSYWPTLAAGYFGVIVGVTLGYRFGEHLDDIRRVMHKVQWGIAAAVVVGLVIYLTRRRRRRLQERTPRAPAPAASAEIRESRT